MPLAEYRVEAQQVPLRSHTVPHLTPAADIRYDFPLEAGGWSVW
jgi:hypothetical protein